MRSSWCTRARADPFTAIREAGSAFSRPQVIAPLRYRSRIGQAENVLDIRDRSRTINSMTTQRKNPYAVALGRKGGRKGGPARAARMTPQERSESARNAVMARWAKVKQQNDR